MIKLTKGDKPEILKSKEVEWAEEYQSHLSSGVPVTATIKFRYRHSEIKEAIKAEAFGKCVYCESKISHISPGQTDHILPVSKRPDLIVDWNNLAFVCEECNRAKSDYYEPGEPLINPFQEDPEEHLRFFGPVVLHAPNDVKGQLTHKQLRLDRINLFERRKEKLEQLQNLLDKWASYPPGRLKELIKNELLKEAEPDKEFSATAKYFLKQHSLI